MNRSWPILGAALAGQLHALSTTGAAMWIFLSVPLLFFSLQATSWRNALVLGGLYSAIAGVEVLAADSYGLFAVTFMFGNLVLYGLGLGGLFHLATRCVPAAWVPALSMCAMWLWGAGFRWVSGSFYVPVTLGDALAGSPLWSQAAALGGSDLLTALLVLWGSGILCACRAGPRRFRLMWVGISLWVPLGMAGWGHLKIQDRQAPNPRNSDAVRELTIRIVQGAVPSWTYDALPFIPAIEDDIFRHYETLSRVPAAVPGLDLVVWPETVLRPSHRSQERLFDRLRALSRDLATSLIVGSAMYEDGNEKPLNGALFLDPAGHLERGGKRWLVPLLENEWRAGDGGMVFRVQGFRVGVVICVESVYPASLRAFANQELDALIVLVNDAGLRHGGREIHARRGSLRAIEMGIPVVHAAQYHDTRVYNSSGVEAARSTGSGAQVIDVSLAHR